MICIKMTGQGEQVGTTTTARNSRRCNRSYSKANKSIAAKVTVILSHFHFSIIFLCCYYDQNENLKQHKKQLPKVGKISTTFALVNLLTSE
jgi:preprotein translocase subunit SecG